MPDITAIASARTALTTTALDGLLSATYVSAGVIDLTAANPLDVLVEVTATPGTVSGNRQVVVFARVSLDGSTFTTGPNSGSVATAEANLKLLGVVPCNVSATQQRNAFSLAGALGFVPPHVEIVVKNDTGAALAASGHAVHYATVIGRTA